MEEQNKERKELVIVQQGKYWKVRNVNYCYDDTFTEYSKAVKFKEKLEFIKDETEFNKALKQIKKEPDIGKKTREYKKLCQNKKSS